MAAKKKGGLINRLIMGSEKSEGYARASLPSNRWELFFDIFKGRFWKLVIVNLLTLIFFIPLIVLIFFRYVALLNYGIMAPFSQGFGVGYQGVSSLVGFNESIVLNVNMMMYLFLPIAVMIAMVGVSGGAYVIRNMVWTEGIFVSNDFWRGIKQNIGQLLLAGLVYSIIFYIVNISIGMVDQVLAVGGGIGWLLTLSKVLSIILLVFISMMFMHMVTMSVTYKLTFWQLIKNAFMFTLGLLPQNIFFLAVGLVPFILMLFGGFFFTIGIILALLFGISYFLLVWTDFCQWAYDKFINDRVPGAQKNRGIYEKVKESDSGALKQYREQLAMSARSSLNSRPIKPITDDELTIAELPTSFNRDDIKRLNESKKVIYEDHERYIEEHKNDPEFQRSEEEIQMEKDQEEREKRIEKAKKELSKRKK
ncbi:MAG: hypothetical protein E7369_00860 [Clostridiales bacterium]|nr:hypothetical protein [Clostridiales bacterium]